MASSSPTTSIPIQEPVFLQFLHDVHHAYLLLHRAMALLPPTLIPNIEPTPLPSTDVWNQPDGLRPHYSDQTNAFIDAVHVPSPDLAEEEALMDDLLEPNLPEPHQHVAAPPPDALPDPSKLSTTASTPAKRKPNAKATPKAPAKRRRRAEQSRSRSSSPLSTWTFEDKQKLRTLKADEKSRFSWRVISTKMGKSEADVRSMWNKIKDRLGWLPAMWQWKKGFCCNVSPPRRTIAYVSPFHAPIVLCHFHTTSLPLSHPSIYCRSTWTTWPVILYTLPAILLCLYAPTWIDIVSNEPWPMTTSHLPDAPALRPEHLPLPREPRHSNVHQTGPLRLLHPIGRLFYNWIWNLCNNLLPEIRTSTSWPPRSQATSLRKHMTAFFKPLRWSTRTTPAVTLFQTWKLWWRILSCNAGRYTCRPPTSTWWSIRIKEPRCLMIFLILFWTFWTGIIPPGRLTNTSMPSRLASARLWWSHPTQIHRIQALLYTFKWFLEGIHSSRQPDIRRMPLELHDIHLANQQGAEKRKRSLTH